MQAPVLDSDCSLTQAPSAVAPPVYATRARAVLPGRVVLYCASEAYRRLCPDWIVGTMEELKRATDALLLGRKCFDYVRRKRVDDKPRYYRAANAAGFAEQDEGYYRHILCQLESEGVLTRERFEHLARPYEWIPGTMEELRERVDRLFDGPESSRAAVKGSLLDFVSNCGVDQSSPAFFQRVIGQLLSLGILTSTETPSTLDNDGVECLASLRTVRQLSVAC